MARPGRTEHAVLRDLGLRIRELRLAEELTQEQLASAIDSDVRDYARLEGGRRNPTVMTLAKIAARLGAPLPALFESPKARVRRPGRPRKDT